MLSGTTELSCERSTAYALSIKICIKYHLQKDFIDKVSINNLVEYRKIYLLFGIVNTIFEMMSPYNFLR